MNHRTAATLVLLAFIVTLAGCAATQVARLADVPPTEAIAVAKFRVLYNNEDVTKGSNVVFDRRGQSPKQQFILDDTGYIFGRFAVGTHSIDILVHKSGFLVHGFSPGELTCTLAGDGVLNYLGDITFTWEGMSSKEGAALAGQSAIAASMQTGGTIAVSLESRPDAAQQLLRQRFSADRSVTPALLVARRSH
jgi:hypothetical protein